MSKLTILEDASEMTLKDAVETHNPDLKQMLKQKWKEIRSDD